MKDFLASAFMWIVCLLLTIASVWAMVNNFQTGHYFIAFIGVFGVLLFGIPLISLLMPTTKDKEKRKSAQVTVIPLPTNKHDLQVLATQLIDDDKSLMQLIQESFVNPQTFYEHKAKTANNDSIDYEAFWLDSKDDIKTLTSIGMLYLLSEANVVRNVDPKEGLEDFLWNVESLVRVKKHHLTIETALLHEELDIPHCCDIINKQWQSSGYQLALIDTDSSDYTITVIQKP